MRYCTVLVFFLLAHFTLYNRLQGNYSTVTAPAIHQHGSAIAILMSPPLWKILMLQSFVLEAVHAGLVVIAL